MSGLVLVALQEPLTALFNNWVLAAKFVLLLLLTALLSVVHFSIQPRIDGLLREVQGESIPAEIAARIAPLRMQRKRLAAICLFLVIGTVLLGLQVTDRFSIPLTVVLFLAAALFAWHVYRTRIPYGWL